MEKPTLIATAIRPLIGDEEAKLSAVRLLETLYTPSPPEESSAITRWSAYDAQKRHFRWKTTIAATAALISLAILASTFFEFREYWNLFRASIGYTDPASQKLLDVSRYNDHEKLLLGLGGEEQTKTEIAKALWDSEPDNPIYFAAYAVQYNREHEHLPPDIDAQAKRIAPNNAFFPYLSAGTIAKDCVKKRSHTRAERAAGIAPGWDVIDEARMNQALAIIHESAQLPDYQNYGVQSLQQIIPLLPQHTHAEYLKSVIYLSNSLSINFIPRDLSSVIAAKASLLGESGDSEGFIALRKDADAFINHLSMTQPGLIIENLITESCTKIILKNLATASEKLHLTGEHRIIQARLDRLETLATDRKSVRFEIDGEPVDTKINILGRSITYIANKTLHPPILTDADVRPGRMIDYEFLAQLCTFGAALILLNAAAAASGYRYRVPKIVRALSARMETLFRPVDWVWLILAGIPSFVYLMLISRLTRLGGTAWNVLSIGIEIPYYDFIPLPVAQFLAMALMTIILQTLTARWRLAKRIPFFGFTNPIDWLGWLAFSSAAAFIPLIGMTVTMKWNLGNKICWPLLAIPLFWLTAAMIRALTPDSKRLLPIATAARVLFPAFAAAAFCSIVFTPYFKAARQHWYEMDSINHLDAAYPSLTKFEYQLSVTAHNELIEALDYKK